MDIKVRTHSLLRLWTSIKKKTDAFNVVNKGTIIMTIQRRRLSKIPPKLLMSHPLEIKKRKLKGVLLYVICGEGIETKKL